MGGDGSQLFHSVVLGAVLGTLSGALTYFLVPYVVRQASEEVNSGAEDSVGGFDSGEQIDGEYTVRSQILPRSRTPG